MKKSVVKYIIIIASCCIVTLALILGIYLLTRNTVVPEVEGISLTSASESLDKNNLKVEIVKEYSDTVKKDIVISQSISPGTEIKKDTAVVLVVSAGIEQITLPDVVNTTIEEAEQTLTDLLFTVSVSEVFSDDVEKGMVITQSVVAGEEADKGSEIQLVISKGPDVVLVPDVSGMTKEEADNAMKTAGLILTTDIKCSNTVKEGLMFSQDIAPGKLIKRNSKVFAYISAGVSNTEGNTPSNSLHHGVVASQGDWVYYSNMNYNYYLHKMRQDGSEKQIIVKDHCNSINVVGEWVYYNCETSEKAGIYKVKLDGSDKTKIVDGANYWVYVVGDWVYYAKKSLGAEIYKVKTDGTENTKIVSDNCSNMIVSGDWIYYFNRNNNYLYKVRTDGTEKTKLHNELQGYDLTLLNNVLYSNSIISGEFQKINTDGSGYMVYNEEFNVQKSFLNANNGFIYYLEHDFNRNTKETAFCIMNSNLNKIKDIYRFNDKSGANFYINVAGDWLYFPNGDDNSYLYRIKTDGTNLQKVYS